MIASLVVVANLRLFSEDGLASLDHPLTLIFATAVKRWTLLIRVRIGSIRNHKSLSSIGATIITAEMVAASRSSSTLQRKHLTP